MEHSLYHTLNLIRFVAGHYMTRSRPPTLIKCAKVCKLDTEAILELVDDCNALVIVDERVELMF